MTSLMIGVAGDSGVGKSRLSRRILDLIGENNARVIDGDDYHRWERGHAMWDEYTHLHPEANHLVRLSEHIGELSAGRLIEKSSYDHGTGRFSPPRVMTPVGTLIVQGLHALYRRELRELCDLKIFIEPSPLLRLAWVLRRDGDERGHSRGRILRVLASRAADFEAYIRPQREFADWIIEPRIDGTISESDVLAGVQPGFSTRHLIRRDAEIEDVAGCLRDAGCAVTLIPAPGDPDRLLLEVTGEPPAEMIRAVASDCFPQREELTGRYPPIWAHGADGLNQLLCLALAPLKQTGKA